MGSSGGTQNFKQPTTPTPPNVAGPGQTAPFNPSFVNFLGDTNVPSTGLTPAMLQQIDSGAYMPKPPPPDPIASDPGLRDMLSKILAGQQQQQERRGLQFQPRLRGAQRNSGGR